MPNLFGVDIAAELFAATKGQLVAGTLTKYTAGTRTPGNLTGGTNPTSANHAFEGFIDTKKESYINGTLVESGGEMVSIIGDSLPSGIIPVTGDRILIEGNNYRISEVERDPAAALYECMVES